jgi:hypothetical protein
MDLTIENRDVLSSRPGNIYTMRSLSRRATRGNDDRRPRAKAICQSLGVLLLILLVACNNGTLANVAKAELAVSTACSAAFQTVTTAAAANPPLISQADANNIVGILLKIEQANAQAETATAAITTLNASNQASLLNIIQPIQTAIAGAINTGAINITDPTTKTAVLASLTAVQVAVTAVVTLIQQVKTS